MNLRAVIFDWAGTLVDHGSRAPMGAFVRAFGQPPQVIRRNARIAAVLSSRTGASTGAIEEGLADVQWPGRLERIGNVLLDAAHNPDLFWAIRGGGGNFGVATQFQYRLHPVGEVLDQPSFLNACLRIESSLEPEALLDACKAIE